MSLRLEMLQVARLAPNLLEAAADRLVEYLQGQINEDGGAKDRSGKSDLYYTVFALEGLMALQADFPVARLESYLRSFDDGVGLDLVHLGCLARCWAALASSSECAGVGRDVALRIAENVERYRVPGGGFSPILDDDGATVYHSFLSLGAYQDLDLECPDVERLVQTVEELRLENGAFPNEKSFPVGTTPTTAAGITLLRYMGRPLSRESGRWLLGCCHAEGGFSAIPNAPMPDLLSTATALHALSQVEVPLDGIKDACLDFIDTLWTGTAFCGNWSDDDPDCEYTYYALLALGHLSL